MRTLSLAVFLFVLPCANMALAADASETVSSFQLPKFTCKRGSGGSITLNASNAEDAVSKAQTIYFIVQDNKGQNLIGSTIDMTTREITCSPASEQ